MEHTEDDHGLLLVCKHVGDENVEELLVEGGEEPSVLCSKCAQIDWSKVDWNKVEEVTKKSQQLHLKPGSPEAKEWFAKNNVPEMDNLHLACKTCTLEIIASKIKTQENQTIESMGPCRDCGKPVLVKHELAASIRRPVSMNGRYNFDIGVSEKELVITIRKRNSSTVTERPP